MKEFDVVYVESDESSVLCRFKIVDTGITVTRLSSEEVVLLLKWEAIEAWWETTDGLVLSEKGANGGGNAVHSFKSDNISALTEAMTNSLSWLLRAKQASILDVERSKQDGASAKDTVASSKFEFKLKQPLANYLQKRRNKFPCKSVLPTSREG